MAYRSTKRGRAVRPKKIWGYGFHWLGRDDRGVHIWNGQIGALKWGIGVLSVTAAGTFLGALGSIAFGALEPAAVLIGVGALHSGIVYLMHRQLKRIGELATPQQAAHNLGLDPKELDRIIDSRAVLPRMIINGEPYFDPADMNDAATLLRASQTPLPSELLRAAAMNPVDTAALLKPAEPDVQLVESITEESLPQQAGHA